MRKFALMTAGLATMITGCVTPTEKNRFHWKYRNRFVNVDALAKEKQTSLAVTNDSNIRSPNIKTKGDVRRKNQHNFIEKLDWYEAEIEASYRFVPNNVARICGALNATDTMNGRASEVKSAGIPHKIVSISFRAIFGSLPLTLNESESALNTIKSTNGGRRATPNMLLDA